MPETVYAYLRTYTILVDMVQDGRVIGTHNVWSHAYSLEFAEETALRTAYKWHAHEYSGRVTPRINKHIASHVVPNQG